MCEILEQALEPGQLLKEEAEVLFSGILLDTKQFTRNTGVRTFAAALFLRGEGANPNEAQMLFKIELSEFVREAMFENNVVVYRNIIAISVFKGEALAGDKIAASKVAERLLGVEGVLASFALCEIDGTVHISARSSGTINVQLVVEKLGGGGHFDMAGAQLPNTSMQQALVQLKKVIDEYLSEE
jgi:c-di-AMP phosphodiesterase-like protein